MLSLIAIPLAAAADRGIDVVKLAITGGVLLLVALAAGVWALLARRRALRGDDKIGSAAAGFSIEELESLKNAGQLSEEEFKLLRRRTIRLDAGAPKEHNELNAGPEADDGKDEAPPGLSS